MGVTAKQSTKDLTVIPGPGPNHPCELGQERASVKYAGFWEPHCRGCWEEIVFWIGFLVGFLAVAVAVAVLYIRLEYKFRLVSKR